MKDIIKSCPDFFEELQKRGKYSASYKKGIIFIHFDLGGGHGRVEYYRYCKLNKTIDVAHFPISPEQWGGKALPPIGSLERYIGPPR